MGYKKIFKAYPNLGFNEGRCRPSAEVQQPEVASREQEGGPRDAQ